MRYAGLIKNDFSAAPGVSVTFFTQGCPHRCPGCHNPATWDYDGGKEFTDDILDDIVIALQENGLLRSLCIMGGEPLCPENELLTHKVIQYVKSKLPEVQIYIWTGYIYEELLQQNNKTLIDIFNSTNYLIDGPYIESERDITLSMRGSRNQRVIKLDKTQNL